VVIRVILMAGCIDNLVNFGSRYTGEPVTSFVFVKVKDDRVADNLHAFDLIKPSPATRQEMCVGPISKRLVSYAVQLRTAE